MGFGHIDFEIKFIPIVTLVCSMNIYCVFTAFFYYTPLHDKHDKSFNKCNQHRTVHQHKNKSLLLMQCTTVIIISYIEL